MADLLQRLGVENTPRVRRNMRSRLAGWQIGTDHWVRSPGRWYSDEQLAEAVSLAKSYAGALRHLGVPVTGGQHAHLARGHRHESLPRAGAQPRPAPPSPLA